MSKRFDHLNVRRIKLQPTQPQLYITTHDMVDTISTCGVRVGVLLGEVRVGKTCYVESKSVSAEFTLSDFSSLRKLRNISASTSLWCIGASLKSETV